MSMTPGLRQEPQQKPVIIGHSPEAGKIREFAIRAAKSDQHILIRGETGTGKDLLAKLIHSTQEAHGEFVWVECAGVPEALFETELFGHTAGAFTDARSSKQGLIQTAKGGTLFISEVGDAPAAIQAKLLRLFEERTFRPVGGTHEFTTDARIIAATNLDLEVAIKNGKFRADLYHRLNRISFTVPPLRERRMDVAVLAKHFLQGTGVKTKFSRKALSTLTRHQWPGNVRELKNVVEQAVFNSDPSWEIEHEHILVHMNQKEWHLYPTFYGPDGNLLPYAQVENNYLRVAIAVANGDKTAASELMGISRNTLYHWMDRHPLLPDESPPES
jgi:two-component system, NtrC family, response regulator AtoC